MKLLNLWERKKRTTTEEKENKMTTIDKIELSYEHIIKDPHDEQWGMKNKRAQLSLIKKYQAAL